MAAAAVAWAAMRFLRATLQVRTLPERLMEWALLFVPLDLFEAVLPPPAATPRLPPGPPRADSPRAHAAR